MAKTPAEARQFLDTLSAKMRPLLEAEFARFCALLSESSCHSGPSETATEPDDGLLAMCDVAFLANLVEERDFAVDQKLLRQYFPLPHVLELMLGTYQVCDRESLFQCCFPFIILLVHCFS